MIMPLVSMRQILDDAAKGSYGVGAFNVNNMEQIQAIMEPEVEERPQIPVALLLDHGNSPESCRVAIELGFTSVMMDGSLDESGKVPNSYEPNVTVPRQIVELAHPLGVTVEGELGCLGGIEDGQGAGLSDSEVQKHRTDQVQAEDFVAKTGLDALAVAIGTSYGAYKSGRADPKTGEIPSPKLAMDRIHQIRAKMPNCHMVMHGSRSVPQELVEMKEIYTALS